MSYAYNSKNWSNEYFYSTKMRMNGNLHQRIWDSPEKMGQCWGLQTANNWENVGHLTYKHQQTPSLSHEDDTLSDDFNGCCQNQ